MVDSVLLPNIRCHIVFVLDVRRNLVLPVGTPGRIDDPGIVPPVRQNEGHIGVGQRLDFVDGSPGCYVVRDRAHGKDWHSNVAQGNRPTVDLEMSSCQGIVEEQAAEVF